MIFTPCQHIDDRQRYATWSGRYYLKYERGMHPRHPYIIACFQHPRENQASHRYVTPPK